MRTDIIESYIRDLLEGLTGTRPKPDGDGDLVVTYRGATFFARVTNPDDAIVQVFGVAVAELEATPELYEAINEINRQIGFARAFWVRGQVLIEAEIWGSDVNPANFQHACGNIAYAIDHFGPILIEQLGGVPLFEELKGADYNQGELFRANGHGPYL